MTSPRPAVVCLGILFATCYAGASTTIQTWNFNSPIDDGNPSTGTFNSVEDQFGTFGYGSTSSVIFDGFGSSDPNLTDNSARGVLYSPSPTGPNKSEGIGFNVNFPGYQDIHLSLDVLFTETSVDRLQVQYRNEFNQWTDFSTIVSQGVGWINDISLDFTEIPSANDNSFFLVRFVRLYASEAGFQAPNGGTYSGGMVGFDDVVWSGTPITVPEPSSSVLAIAGTFLLPAIFRRTRRNLRADHGTDCSVQ